MTRLPEIKFELLRGGPPHNQLISPITEYLALCGDAAPFTLRLPFEHRDLTDRLGALRYERQGPAYNEARTAELHRLGRDIGTVLGSVPAFASEITGMRPDGHHVVHLRFVLAGNELAIVPWETAHIPAGLPGAGIPLLLHPSAPATLTREVRGASRRKFNWNRPPRVLFVTTTADDFPPGTIDSHLLGLFGAMDVWAYSQWTDNGWRIEHAIEVIEQASVERIREACKQHAFTHVHILAHGKRVVEGSDARFGLYLHDSRDPKNVRDIVTGERLALALRGRCCPDTCTDPLVVTLATCDSGAQTSVVVPGGSVAHELHQFGVPWVIASQLPLTVTGSVVVVQDLYKDLLSGDDPRRSLQCLRSHLASRFADRHDWASLVVYASVPGDFDMQIKHFRVAAAKAMRDRGYTLVDLLAFKWVRDRGEDVTPTNMVALTKVLPRLLAPLDEQNFEIMLDKAYRSMREAAQALARGIPVRDESQAAHSHEEADERTAHAALLKRLAELQWLYPRAGEHCLDILKRSRDEYLRGARVANTSDHWAIGQVLVLDAVIEIFGGGRELAPLRSFEWSFACNAAHVHIERGTSEESMWALSTLADLYMVAIIHDKPLAGSQQAPSAEDVGTLIDRMAAKGDTAIWPTFRQFFRYKYWWRDTRWQAAADMGFERLLQLVERRLAPRALDPAAS